MAVIKPYTFVAGTKAKAAEVNENFDVLYTEVNALGSTVVDYQSQIEQLASEKANVNGNYANRFSVANPTTNYDAVNKQTLFNTISNSLPYIYGLGITKVGNNTISVAAGECYDTTETTLLKLDGNLEKQNRTQAASSSYYVYIIGGPNVNEDILISTRSLNPNLPDGYTLSRRIGSYTTDTSNKILKVNNEQINQYTTDNFLNQNATVFQEKVFPNLNSIISIGRGWQATSNGWIIYRLYSSASGPVSMTIDGKTVAENWQGVGDGRAGGLFIRGMVPISKGQIVQLGLNQAGDSDQSLQFCPCKGV